MSPGVFAMLSCAGGVGATMRMTVDGWIRSSTRTRYQWATMIINVTGSFVLGFLTGLSDIDLVDSAWYLVIGVGLLGGYTTFSTASYETVELIRQRKHAQALLSSVGMLAGCVTVAALGLWLGKSI